MIKYEDIRDVHLEISTLCNAMCPLCPRNFRGYPHNDGYPEINFTLQNAKKIFSPDFLNQLDKIRINGNYGDIMMNPEGADIVEYFRDAAPRLIIEISTNASARTPEFWTRLAKAKAHVMFCLDGLEDTHHLYRQNTSWKTIIKNAKIFIGAGGYAIWKFVKFDHNIHQYDACYEMSKDLGFSDFIMVDHGRNIGPVFNKHGQFTHTIGAYDGTTEFKILFHKKRTDDVFLEDIVDTRTPKCGIECKSTTLKSIYVAANGDVSPCCWTGFYPKTFGHGEYHQAVNAQLAPLSYKNNALEYPIQECMEWFTEITNAWKHTTYESGRLVVCDDVCGF